MNSAKIAFRNMYRQKKRIIFLAGAIAFGIMVMTLLNSLVGSVTGNIAANFSDIYAGHIFISGKEKNETGRDITVIKDNHLLEESIQEAGIDYKFITRRSAFNGTLYFEGTSVGQTVVGADWVQDSYFTQRVVLEGGSFEDLKNTPDGIIISRPVADILKADVNDRIRLEMKTAQGQKNSSIMYIVGISIDPGFVGTVSSLANISKVNTLLNIGQDEYMTMGIYMNNIRDTDAAAIPLRNILRTKVNLDEKKEVDEDQDMFEAMMAAMDEDEEDWKGVKYSMSTINEELSDLKDIIAWIDTIAIYFFIILILITMVGINNTFRIVMIERIKEIGTMRAIGTQKNEVFMLFLLEAIFISIVGIAAGYILAFLVMGITSLIDLGMNSPIFIVLKNGRFTFSLNILKMLMNSGIVVVLTAGAVLFPALKAARLRPAEALRSQK